MNLKQLFGMGSPDKQIDSQTRALLAAGKREDGSRVTECPKCHKDANYNVEIEGFSDAYETIDCKHCGYHYGTPDPYGPSNFNAGVSSW